MSFKRVLLRPLASMAPIGRVELSQRFWWEGYVGGKQKKSIPSPFQLLHYV